MYLKCDGNGRIDLVSREGAHACDEYLAADSLAMLTFLTDEECNKDHACFHPTDLAFVRVLDDMVELLVSKGVISFTEMTEEAQKKVMERQSLRRRLFGLQLLDMQDDEGGVI